MKFQFSKMLAAFALVGALWASSAGIAPVAAADARVSVHASGPISRGAQLPFPRSEQAQSVWASGACWTDCASYCAWGQTSCLHRDSQGQCLKVTDDCDRSCQRACRTSGGPLLPLDF